MPAEDCGDLRTIAWTGEQEGAPICLAIRYSRAHRCRPCMMAIAPQGEKGSFLAKCQYGRDQRRTCPPSGCEPRFARYAPTPKPNRPYPPRPASALCLRGSCALWAVRTGSGGGSHQPTRFTQYAPCSDARSIRFAPIHCRPMPTRFGDGKARQ